MRTQREYAEHDDDRAAEMLTMMTLAARQSLPHAANGSPKASSNLRAGKKRADLQQGRSNPWGALMMIAECDLNDGASIADVTEAFRFAIARLEAKARMQRTTRSILSLIHVETRAQAQFDLDELRLIANPRDKSALQHVMRSASLAITTAAQVRDAATREYAEQCMAEHHGRAMSSVGCGA